MSLFRMCDGKVRFSRPEQALAEASKQQAQRPHWTWQWYDCLWCDFLHIGRGGLAPGHTEECRSTCERKRRHAKEARIIEGTW